MNDRFRMLPSYHYEDSTDGMLLKSAGKPLREYKIEGNSVQDGTPTLDNPIEIESVGELTKNLSRATLYPAGNDSTYGLYKNGFYGTAKTNTGGHGNYVRTAILLDFEWGKTYTFSCFVEQSIENMNSFMRIGYINTSYAWKDFKTLTVINNSINSITVTLPTEKPSDSFNDGVSLFFNIQRNALDECGTIYVTDIMVNEGDTALPYEPVHPRNKYRVPITVSSDDKEPITTYIYLDEPLRKIGDYADYMEFKKGKVFRRVSVIDDSGEKTIDESFELLQTPTEEPIELPKIPTYKGTNIITVGTSLQPGAVNYQYYKGGK